jgi:hypothetical protein
MTFQQKLNDFKAQFESDGPPDNAPKAAIEIFRRDTESCTSPNWPISSAELLAKGSAGNDLLPWPLVTLLRHGAGGSTNSFS